VISYREAAELAYFGAKVLHPKTLNPVVQAAIPVWIRNSFAPEKPGTKITPEGRSIGGGVKALTAIRDVTLISVGRSGNRRIARCGRPHVCNHRRSARQRAADFAVLLAKRHLLHRFDLGCPANGGSPAQRIRARLGASQVEHITVDSNIASVAVVGENMRGTPGIAGRTFNALGRENVNLIAIGPRLFGEQHLLRD